LIFSYKRDEKDIFTRLRKSFVKVRNAFPRVSTACIRDLDKLNLIWRFDFRLKPIFATASASSKSTSKRGQKWPKLIISLLLTMFSLSPWRTLYKISSHFLWKFLLYIISYWLRIWSRSYQTFFLRKHIIFPFFAVKLGHFIVNTFFFTCYKHSSLAAQIGKQKKTKFGWIDSWLEP
jgi:hypothetical protein